MHISKCAHDMLGLDEIWWLVSPHNVLKDKRELASFEDRFTQCEFMTADEKFIKISDFEQRACENITIKSLRLLKKEFPQNNFVWLMGADNLIQFHLWDEWEEIFATVPIAVLDRADDKKEALASQAAVKYEQFRINENFTNLALTSVPVWCFLEIVKHPESSTNIRNTLAQKRKS